MSDLAIFDTLQTAFEAETEIREKIKTVVKDLETTTRKISSTLSRMHTTSNTSTTTSTTSATTILSTATDQFTQLRSHLAILATMIPRGQLYKFSNYWSYTLQQACFLAALVVYYRDERLITLKELEEFLGVPVRLNSNIPPPTSTADFSSSSSSDFHLTIEDILHGFVSLSSELSRLAINAVTHGHYSKPLSIQTFLTDLFAGLQLLNLKNDALRKRFDAVKYDLKKVEEVVYDVSVRGLVNVNQQS